MWVSPATHVEVDGVATQPSLLPQPHELHSEDGLRCLCLEHDHMAPHQGVVSRGRRRIYHDVARQQNYLSGLRAGKCTSKCGDSLQILYLIIDSACEKKG
jgi:hypothetical protein